MKAQLQKVLSTTVHPLLGALPAALLVAGLGQSSLFITQIACTEDNTQAMFQQPYPNQLWLSPHRAEILAPYLPAAK